MSEIPYMNPYAAPQAELIPAWSGGARIEAKSLVVPKGWTSPRICLKTGATTDLLPIRKRKLVWSNPLWLLLILLIGFFVVLFLVLLQKKGTIHYYLSTAAAARQKKKLLINWAVFGLGLLIAVYGFQDVAINGRLALAGALLIFLSAILYCTWCRLIVPGKIDKTHIWLRGIPPSVREAIISMEQGSLDYTQQHPDAAAYAAAPPLPAGF